ncbi:MAG: replication protein [Endomicrobiaceae bacterium]|nr:replication protein [Endomicrobiaceae bacterium]
MEEILQDDDTPQLENGYTKIANEILVNLANTNLSGQSFQMLMLIFRMTYGYGRRQTIISLDYFVEETGIAKTNALRCLKGLADQKIILREKTRFGTVYSFNKDPKKWQLKSVKKAAKVIKNDNAIIQIDNKVIQNDNAIIQIDNNCSQSIKEEKRDNNIYENVSCPQSKTEKLPKNADIYKENSNKEKDLLLSNESNANDLFNQPQKTKPKKEKRSLLDSPNATQRICGYWDKVFSDKYSCPYKHNFGKDMMIFSKLSGDIGEDKAREIINIFFEWVDDQTLWQYGKPEIGVFSSSINALVVENIRRKKTVKKQASAVLIPEEKKDFMTVKFDVMMTDLKKQYGNLNALAHVSEYKKQWLENLKNLIVVLKTKNGK